MVVSQRTRYLAATIVGIVVFVIAMIIAREAYPWGSWRGERHYSYKTLETARENIEEYIQQHGKPPQTLLEIYGSEDQLPRDLWNRVLEYHPSETGYELKSLGSDGQPGGFGGETDLPLDKEWLQVTMPSISEFILYCVTSEIWMTAAASALIAVGMMLWTTTATKTPHLTLLHFMLALIVTLIVSWFVGGIMMALKVGPQH